MVSISMGWGGGGGGGLGVYECTGLWSWEMTKADRIIFSFCLLLFMFKFVLMKDLMTTFLCFVNFIHPFE